jgi:hypothetical protein
VVCLTSRWLEPEKELRPFHIVPEIYQNNENDELFLETNEHK